MNAILHLSEGPSAHSAAITSQRELELIDFCLELPKHRSGKLMLAEYEELKAGSKENKNRAAADKDGSWFSFAKFHGKKRAAKAVVAVSACVIDLDRGNLSADDIATKLPGLQHIAYTTYSSSSASLKWRVIVPYSRPATPDEHARAFQHFGGLFELDGSTRDASRLWFWPACCADTEQDAAILMRLEGAPFDIDALLSAPAEDKGSAPEPATAAYTSDHWFEALSEADKVAELRALVATWAADKATERESWFTSIRIIADAAARGVPFDTALDIAEHFSKRTTEKNLATRDEIAAKMREPGKKPSVYAAITAAENLGYVSTGRAKQIAAEFEAASDADDSETPEAPRSIGNRLYPVAFRFKDVASARAELTKRFYMVRGKQVELYDTVLRKTFTPKGLQHELKYTLPLVQSAEGKTKASLASVLLDAAQKTVVDGVCYAPGVGSLVPFRGELLANTFRGFPTVTERMTLSKARAFVHLLWFIRGRRIKEYGVEGTIFGKSPAPGAAEATLTQPVLREPWVRFYIHSLAYLLQNPGARLHYVLALVGREEGTGKSMLTLALPSALFGEQNTHVFGREMEGRFTGQMFDSCILVLEEFTLHTEDRQLQKFLWQAITSDSSLTAENKGKDATPRPFFGSFFASSNNRDNFARLGDTARRFAVEEVLPTERMPSALGQHAKSAIHVGVGASRREGTSMAALRGWLLAYKIPDSYSPFAQPPTTQVLRDVREASRGSWESTLQDYLDAHPVGLAEIEDLHTQLWSSARPKDGPPLNHFSGQFKAACRAKHIATPATTPRVGRTPNKRRVLVWGLPEFEAFRFCRAYGSVLIEGSGPITAESAEALEHRLSKLLKNGPVAVTDPLME
jgi:hypothetical protein